MGAASYSAVYAWKCRWVNKCDVVISKIRRREIFLVSHRRSETTRLVVTIFKAEMRGDRYANNSPPIVYLK